MSDKAAMQNLPIQARSWLFAPGDSERKMRKAAESAADIVICDLEDAVADSAKPAARTMIRDFLAGKDHAAKQRLWVRINPIGGPHALLDLAAVMPSAPGGIMLPKARGREDVDLLDHYLSAFETTAGIPLGSTRAIILVTEAAEGMFTTNSYVGAPRVCALSWGAEDLADALGASENRSPDGSYGFTYQLARSLCLLGASVARVTPVETIQGDFRDLEGLRRRAEQARRDGYRGMLAIHPAQVEIINAAFSPSREEIAAAREIVDLFAAHPDAGTIGYKGGMLDRPHLARAQALLALAMRGDPTAR